MKISKIHLLLLMIGLAIMNISCAPYWYHDQFSTVIYPKGYRGPGGGETVYLGMSKNEVISLLGAPSKEKYYKKEDKEIFIYSDLMGGGSKVTLTFINEKLARIDELCLEGFF